MTDPTPTGPTSPQQQTGLTETHLKHHLQELGLIGKVFGGRENAPMNIAGLVVVVAIFAVIYILVWGSDTPTLTRKDALAIVGGFITLTLGFIFGRSSN